MLVPGRRCCATLPDIQIREGNMLEHRRRAVEKALARAAALDIKVDDDPVFADLIERWVNGRLSMPEAREAYLAHIRERDQSRADWRALSISAWRSKFNKKTS